MADSTTTQSPSDPGPDEAGLRKALVDAAYAALRNYRMSNMVDEDNCPYPLVDLVTPKGRGIDEGEVELGEVTFEVAVALLAGPLAPLLAERAALRFRVETVTREEEDTSTRAFIDIDRLRKGLAKEEARATAAEARVRDLEEALVPFAEAWDGCEAIGEQTCNYVQDEDHAWIGGYPFFKFGDLRRARSLLTKEKTDVAG